MSPRISKSSLKTSGRKAKTSKRVPPHTVWEYKPKLQNEAVVLHSILSIYDIPYYKEIVDDIRGLITQLVRNHGFRDGSDRYKIIKDYTLSLIEGRNPDNPGWLATSEVYRVPSALGKNLTQLVADYFQINDVSLKPKYYQVINTILNIVRIVEGLVDADLQSVTDKAQPIDQYLLDNFTNYVNKRLDDIEPIDSNINLFNIRFNLKKNGPNGVPKIESSIQEAHALLNSKLARPFRIICEELNCEYLYEYLTVLTNDVSKDQENSNLQPDKLPTIKLRVLASVPDKGFKTRLVAIVDFWSQLILEPFRSYVQATIEKKFGKTDFRKDQDLGVTQMVAFQQRCLERETVSRNGKTITLDAKHLKCYDISSWTDKFHRDLQKIVVRKLFNPRFAEAWGQLVVHCDWYYPKLDCTVKYGQGQGMGTNGSFDIATLTDHLFINYVIDKHTSLKGIFPNNECYGKVGDDLWIYDPENQIPTFYERIHLPINVSKSKMFVNGNSYMEFCARTFLDAEDVSRISPNIISKSKDYRYIPMLLGLCSSRGIQLDASLFETLNNTVKGSELTYLHKLQDWIVGMLLIGQYEQSSYWKSLTYDYLVTGNWVIGDLVKGIYQDPKLLTRLMIAHSIVTIIDNLEAVQDKIFEIVGAMDDYSDEIVQLVEFDTNLFDINNPKYKVITKANDLHYLTPKQIVVLGRYVDQKRLLHFDLVEIKNIAKLSDDPKSILEFSKALSMIAHKSCYDEGNINYNIDRVYGTQYRIVKTIERMDESYTTLSGIQSHQLRPLWQCLPYSEIADKWEGYLPELQVDN
jgi:hypothetical protein